ncbi:MAG: hypothetical protein KBS85_00920 [Lachnospiraceae bacterium]|nr:hypothetical protein [Candidatus Merdinaster equi]
MKKIVSLLLASAMILSLCACGDNKTDGKSVLIDNDAKGYVISENATSYESAIIDKKEGDYMEDVSGAELAEMDKGAGCMVQDIAHAGIAFEMPVTIYNLTDYNLMKVYIAAEDDPSWGKDLLGEFGIINYSYGTINMFIYGCAVNYNMYFVFDNGYSIMYPAVYVGDRMTSGFDITISQEMGMKLFIED